MGSNEVTLRPVDLQVQPAPFQDRHKILHKLYDQMVKCRLKVPKGKLQRMAIELESRIAKSSSSVQGYRFNMSVLLRDIIKYKGDFKQITIAGKPIVKGSKSIATVSKTKVMEQLRALLITSSTLTKHGYIMDKIIPNEEINQDIVYVNCARCNTRFKRSEIMEKTLCTYHPSKKIYNRETKSYMYPCCGESTESTSILRLGCNNFSKHVFKEDKYVDLRRISDFLMTGIIDGHENVLALDCEMAFTSKGFEMVRLTVVDFFTLKTVFDEIIDPFGDIIDLNSLFSGIHESDMRKAISYQDAMDKILTKDLINRNSILIGHGLENDLNVMRIIHGKILDTAVLYSNGRYKVSLKNLTFETLSETIQTGEHDSSQDAIATMNIIKKKIGVPIDQTEWKQ